MSTWRPVGSAPEQQSGAAVCSSTLSTPSCSSRGSRGSHHSTLRHAHSEDIQALQVQAWSTNALCAAHCMINGATRRPAWTGTVKDTADRGHKLAEEVRAAQGAGRRWGFQGVCGNALGHWIASVPRRERQSGRGAGPTSAMAGRFSLHMLRLTRALAPSLLLSQVPSSSTATKPGIGPASFIALRLPSMVERQYSAAAALARAWMQEATQMEHASGMPPSCSYLVTSCLA